ncbi:hypothetical protein PAMC26510_22660 [Caballeronia sordidicola]|uniref:Uncharacterized protein n=1 Tax=Caballeronia sordidicola TaxID=196367 RepID=A0A242MMJ2_CABSO|nr:hypothetical protein PAMC26510_22660 [Caballeronia sordidicola]
MPFRQRKLPNIVIVHKYRRYQDRVIDFFYLKKNRRAWAA